MRILITGAGGFIGRHLAASLAKSHEVYAVARQPENLPAGVQAIAADLLDPDWTDELPTSIDAVVALAQSRRYREFPEGAVDLCRVNVGSLVELADWARRAGAKHLIYTSTANVYAPRHRPMRETSPLRPSSFYGQTKRMAEQALESFREFFGVTVLRLFTVYGPGQSPSSLVPRLIDRVAQRQAVTLEGNQGLLLSPAYVGDVVEVVRRAIDQGPPEEGYDVLNVGGAENVSLRHVAETIAELLDQPARFEHVSEEEPGGWMSDNSRLEQALAYRPSTTLRDGLRLTIAAQPERAGAAEAPATRPTPRPAPFTWAAYALYLDAALAAGYTFVDYEAVRYDRQPDIERLALLRHDIDYDPRCIAAKSRLEAERSIRATYFFLPNSPFYDFEATETQAAIGRVLDDGHALGLHFDATAIDDDRLVLEQVEELATAWERRYQTTVSAVSFHMPSHRRVDHLTLSGGRINTYAPAFFRRFDYLSDSNQDWRGRDPIRVLSIERPPRLQWLTHPMWWRERHTPMLTCLEEMAGRLGISVERDVLTPEQWHLLKRRREAA